MPAIAPNAIIGTGHDAHDAGDNLPVAVKRLNDKLARVMLRFADEGARRMLDGKRIVILVADPGFCCRCWRCKNPPGG